MLSISERLVAARKKANLNQEEMATRLKVSTKKVRKLETAEDVPDVSLRFINDYCLVVGLPLHEAIFDDAFTAASIDDLEHVRQRLTFTIDSLINAKRNQK